MTRELWICISKYELIFVGWIDRESVGHKNKFMHCEPMLGVVIACGVCYGKFWLCSWTKSLVV